MLGRCYIGMVSEWEKHVHKMWVCGFHGRIKEYLLEAKRRKINFFIDLLTHIDNTVFILFIYMLILTKYIFTSGIFSNIF